MQAYPKRYKITYKIINIFFVAVNNIYLTINTINKKNNNLKLQVAHSYRTKKKSKLQRTFVSASDAAEDRARGVKREGGIVKDTLPLKSMRINFVKQGEADKSTDITEQGSDNEIVNPENIEIESKWKTKDEKATSASVDSNEYINELLKMNCVDVRRFRDSMFNTPFGRLVLLIRPWTSKLGNIQGGYIFEINIFYL